MLYNTHTHILTWVIGILLFAAAVYLFKKGMARPLKIVHMTLRLFYLLILLTGIVLFFEFAGLDHMMYGLKFVGGVAVIAFAEITLARMKKGKSTGGVIAGLVISLLVTLYLGFSLPVGFDFLP